MDGVDGWIGMVEEGRDCKERVIYVCRMYVLRRAKKKKSSF